MVGAHLCCCFLWGLMRVAPSQVQAHPLPLFLAQLMDEIYSNQPEAFSHLGSSDLRGIKGNVDQLNIIFHQRWYFLPAVGILFH